MASAIEVGYETPRSDEEKKSIDAQATNVEVAGALIDDLPDPDARLSEEERAAHVCLGHPSLQKVFLILAGSQVTLEARSETHPMAFIPVPGFFPGQDQHWQCQTRWPAGGSTNDKQPI